MDDCPGAPHKWLYNPTFAEWFPNVQDAGHSLDTLLDAAGGAELIADLKPGETRRAEIEVKPKRRPYTLAVEASLAAGEALPAILLQFQNISKIKELEFMIESYSKMIERQNRDLRREKERVEGLLLNIMPRTIYDEWKEFGITTPQRVDEATVLMLDFVGFTQMSVAHDPVKLIAELNDIFTSFDRIVDQSGCERIKTIGDAYMAVSGVPEHNPDHARNVAVAALRFVRYLRRRNQASEFEWRCRIGIATGPVIGSVVGVQKFLYDIFGPAVNLSARLEPLCGPMEVMVSEATHDLLKTSFRMSDRGEHDIRGFGPSRIYCLESALAQVNTD